MASSRRGQGGDDDSSLYKRPRLVLRKKTKRPTASERNAREEELVAAHDAIQRQLLAEQQQLHLQQEGLDADLAQAQDDVMDDAPPYREEQHAESSHQYQYEADHVQQEEEPHHQYEGGHVQQQHGEQAPLLRFFDTHRVAYLLRGQVSSFP